MKKLIIAAAILSMPFSAIAGSAKYRCKINDVTYHKDLTNTVTATCTLVDLFGNSDILDIREICAKSKKGEVRCGHGDDTWRLRKNEYVKFTHTFGKTKNIITKVYVKD